MGIMHRLLRPLVKTYIKSRSKKNLPNYNQSVQLPCLEQPVEIIRDRWAVPHIYSETDADAFRAQGYAHAQDRLWQMEVFRRVALGTLAEAVGKDGLVIDRVSRSMGFARMAKRDVQQSSLLQTLVQPYIEGVNAFLAGEPALPPEYKLLGLKPRPWEAADVFAVGRFLALQMSQGWVHEIERWQLVQQYGLERAQELFPEYPKSNPTPLEGGNATFQRIGDLLEAFKGPYLRPILGSNNWVVAPEKMDNGQAYLCNDPHLIINAPNIWYENHLNSKEGYHCTGVSVPGAPLILIGHNANIAWGMTLTYADVQDVYVEQFSKENFLQYRSDEAWKTATIIQEKIKVKGKKEPIDWPVRVTDHGPIIAELEEGRHLALCSRALQEHEMFEGFYGLNIAKDWDGFVAAGKQLETPSLNIVYADTQQNIGYYMVGQVPIRKKADGLLPRDGSQSSYDWKGYVPHEEMPHTFNPEKGYFYTCNNKIIDDDFPHDLGAIWMNGYRAARLKQLLESKEQYTETDFMAWQLDKHSLPGLAFAELVAEHQKNPAYQALPKRVQDMAEIFVQWDGMLIAESAGGAIYQQLKLELVQLIFEPHKLVRGMVTHPKVELFMLSEFFGYDVPAILRFFKQPASSWWRETPEATLLKALKQTEAALSKRFGARISAWNWGDMHVFNAKHTLGTAEILTGIWDVGPYPVGGDTDTLCQNALVPGQEDGNHSMIGPSFRQILNLGDWDKGWCNAPLGQSGNLQSKHYQDQQSDWLQGRYKPMCWSRAKVEEEEAYRCTLKPKS